MKKRERRDCMIYDNKKGSEIETKAYKFGEELGKLIAWLVILILCFAYLFFGAYGFYKFFWGC